MDGNVTSAEPIWEINLATLPGELTNRFIVHLAQRFNDFDDL